MDQLVVVVLVTVALAIPVALAWGVAFLLFRRRRTFRMLFTIASCASLIAIWPEILFFAPFLAVAILVTIILFEWAVQKDMS